MFVDLQLHDGYSSDFYTWHTGSLSLISLIDSDYS